ncbi:hypothetical protein YC2023_038951 [Brassica napus]
MSRSLLVFFLDLVAGEVRNPSSRFLHLFVLFYLGSLIPDSLVVDIYIFGRCIELGKGLRPMCAGATWWNDIYVCLGRYIVSCWVMWQSFELA